MIWSDCYATLALAAQATKRIKIGTGVAIPGTRIAPVTAHSIATLLDVTNQVPFIDMSVEADAEFHRYVLLMRRARAAGSKTVSTVGLQAGSAIPVFLVLPRLV